MTVHISVFEETDNW